jgi:hypothetical protein
MLDAAASVEAVHHRHRCVQQHNIGAVLQHLADGFGSVRSFVEDLSVSLWAEDLADTAQNCLGSA